MRGKSGIRAILRELGFPHRSIAVSDGMLWEATPEEEQQHSHNVRQ
jgi:hypothetical protein